MRSEHNGGYVFVRFGALHFPVAGVTHSAVWFRCYQGVAERHAGGRKINPTEGRGGGNRADGL